MTQRAENCLERAAVPESERGIGRCWGCGVVDHHLTDGICPNCLRKSAGFVGVLRNRGIEALSFEL